MADSELKLHITGESGSAVTAVKNLTTELDGAQKGAVNFGRELSSTVASLLTGFGVALSVDGVLSFGKAIMADADALVKMSDKTGITVTALQRLQALGDDTSVSIGEITGAISKLQTKLVDGDSSAVAAVKRLGLSVEDLLAMTPDQAFAAIATAIQGIHDPAIQASTAMALFGKSGLSVLPALKADMDALKDSTVVMSEETIRSLDEAGDMLSRFGRTVKVVSAEALVTTVRWVQDGLNPTIHAAREAAREVDALYEQVARMTKALKVPPKVMAAELVVSNSETNEASIARFVKDSDVLIKQHAKDLADSAKAAVAASKATAAALDDSVKGMHAFHAEGVDAAQAVAKSLLGPLDVLGRLSREIAVLNDSPIMVKVGIDASQAEGLFGSRLDSTSFGGLIGSLAPQVKGFGKQNANTFTSGFETGLHDLPGVILKSIQGGGHVAEAVGSEFGSSIGHSVDSSLQKSISKHFTGIGSAVLSGLSSMIPVVGALVGPLISKLTGGPSETELKGRSIAADFEASIAKTLTATQRLEAGSEKWKQTLVGVRDGYVQAGHSAAEAETIVTKLWDAEKRGPEAVKAVQAEIQSVLDVNKQALAELPNILNQVSSGFNSIAAATISTQDGFDRTGRLAVSAFGAAIAGGQSLIDAVATIGPGLDNLTESQKGFGFASSDTLQQLLSFRKFAETNKDLVASIDGVNSMMQGLSKMGRLTQGDFDDLNSIAVETFNTMVAQGLDGRNSLKAMQPTLQEIWRQQRDYGLAVDDSTQALLTQAEQQGIVGEEMRSVEQQTLDVLKAIATALGATIPGAAQQAKNALNDLPRSVNIDINANWNIPSFPGAETAEIPSFANRPMERVTSAGYALLHPGDLVGVPRSGMGGVNNFHFNFNDLAVMRDRASMDDLARSVTDAMSDRLRNTSQLNLRGQ